ncbi:DUF805 domain-containing protein [Phenylobacterium deserti]|uniref:DUF805 domain-containing protein n=1 Tax=Phenylobacterium deserti TaxID=1914756 RepID=A0A328AA76_9CAUL|nr:DUF805 domain-containing protein [Phenylobacterium deserti]RAK51550.1 hypothetical protein DJ018_16610 [Phenylobacterium deserti]
MSVEPARKRRSFWWYLQGRAGRREYWIMVALIIVLGVLFSQIGGAAIGGAMALMLMMIRRLHDFGRTGWWAALVIFGPLVLMLALMTVTGLEMAAGLATLTELVGVAWIGAVPGDAQENRFGPPPPFTARQVLLGR